MKKVGILTYHSVCNFGANLQALSTVGYFRKHGFEPIVLHWVPQEVEDQYLKSIPSIQYHEHERFVSECLPITSRCRTEEEIIGQIREHSIDAVVIGSDAVTQHKSFISRFHFPTRKFFSLDAPPPPHLVFPNPFWGSFIDKLDDDIPIMMMSVSSQNEKYRGIIGPIRRRMSSVLKRLAYVSVRDRWTQKMFQHISRGVIKPLITPDPVFSFNQNAGELIPSKQSLIDKFGLAPQYILLSFVEKGIIDPKWIIEFSKLAHTHGMECVMLPMPKGHIYDDIPGVKFIPLPLSPLEWYGLIKYSTAYVGHNMHPMVVAMHNCVPFHVFDYYGIVQLKLFVNEKSSKIYDILRQAKLLSQRTRDVGMGCHCPRPSDVFASILNLKNNAAASVQFRDEIWKEYDSMMTAIAELINTGQRQL